MKKVVTALIIARRGLSDDEARALASERLAEASEGVFFPLDEPVDLPIFTFGGHFHGFLDRLVNCRSARDRRIYDAVHGTGDGPSSEPKPSIADLCSEMVYGRDPLPSDARRLTELAVLANHLITPDAEFIDTITGRETIPHLDTLLNFPSVKQKQADYYLVPVLCEAMEVPTVAGETLARLKRLFDKAA